MASSNLPTPASASLPATLVVLTSSPLIPGDDTAAYDTLLAHISATVRPTDLIEQAWVRDVVDLIWEALRLRRLKAALMTACADEGLAELLRSLNVRGSPCASARSSASTA